MVQYDLVSCAQGVCIEEKNLHGKAAPVSGLEGVWSHYNGEAQ